MLRKMVVLLICLGAFNPAWGEECFSLDRLFESERSNEELTEELNRFHALLIKFFYIKEGKSYDDVPLKISWSTARELSRYMDQEGFDVRVREDLQDKEMESIYGASVGAALVAGFTLGQFGSPKMKALFQKMVVPRLATVGAGVLGGAGAIFGGWFGGGQYMPGGNCDLVIRSPMVQQGIPLSRLSFDYFMEGGPAEVEEVEEEEEEEEKGTTKRCRRGRCRG